MARSPHLKSIPPSSPPSAMNFWSRARGKAGSWRTILIQVWESDGRPAPDAPVGRNRRNAGISSHQQIAFRIERMLEQPHGSAPELTPRLEELAGLFKHALDAIRLAEELFEWRCMLQDCDLIQQKKSNGFAHPQPSKVNQKLTQ